MLSQNNMHKINVMVQQSFSVQGVFKNQRVGEREKDRERAAGQINGKAFALESDITSNSRSGAFCSI